MAQVMYEQIYPEFRKRFSMEWTAGQDFELVMDFFVVCAELQEAEIHEVAKRMMCVSEKMAHLIEQAHKTWNEPKNKELLQAWIDAGLVRSFPEAMCRLGTV